MTYEEYRKEIEHLETRVENQRRRIISLEYDLGRVQTQAAVFSRRTLQIFEALGFKSEEIIRLYRDIQYLEDNVAEA